jgi:uncharacterized membrane protein
MPEKINLKKIEKKAWKSYHQDGLWDILLGLILLNFGIAPILEDITGTTYLLSYIIILVAAFLIFYGGKKYITTPRLGRAGFSIERKSKTKKTSIVLTISVILGLIVFMIAATDILPIISNIHFGALAFGINAIIVFSLMAYYLDFNRLYLYGWFFAGSIALVEFSRNYVGSTYDNVIFTKIFLNQREVIKWDLKKRKQAMTYSLSLL